MLIFSLAETDVNRWKTPQFVLSKGFQRSQKDEDEDGRKTSGTRFRTSAFPDELAVIASLNQEFNSVLVEQEIFWHDHHFFAFFLFKIPRLRRKEYRNGSALGGIWIQDLSNKRHGLDHSATTLILLAKTTLKLLLTKLPGYFNPTSILSTFLPTSLTPHFCTDYLTIGTLATKWVQLLITQPTVATQSTDLPGY